ncbi:hypothetical protein HCN44_005241 [Aphidius gifuensis]|uniref:Uncharacterized protein n=1 Tax=Aphidius gifuensis TaxID=684658 RepID=A0A835CV84_APHGI|nr:hypothetical protein HCN44_005241 [Aphidius gifuensis]
MYTDNSQRKSKRSIIKPTRFREDDSSDDEPAPKKKNTSASRVDKVHLKKRSGSSRQAQYYHRQKALKSYHQAFPYDVLFRGFQDVNIQDNTSASKKSFTESAEDEEQEEENTVPDNSNDDTEHYFNANYSMKDDSHYSNLQSKDSSEDFVSTTSSDDDNCTNGLETEEIQTCEVSCKNLRDRNHEANNSKPFFSCALTEFLDSPIWNHKFSKKDFILTRIVNFLHSRETYQSLLNCFKTFNDMTVNGNLPNHKPSLWRVLGRDNTNIVKHIYCSRCHSFFGFKNSERLQSKDCVNNTEHEFSYFLQLGLKSQIIELFSHPNINNLLSYRFKRPETNTIRDIYDGEKYKQLCKAGNFLYNRFNYSITFSTDGVSMGDTTNKSAWPIWAQINELPPHSRHKHMMLAGLWIDKTKPIFTDFLLPFASEMRDLYTTGIVWKPEGIENVTSKFISPVCTVDSVARCDVLNMKQYNGFNGCTYCSNMGHSISKQFVYLPPSMLKEKTTLRTHDGMLSSSKEAHETKTVVHGIKGVSALAIIPGMKLDTGLPVDALHALWIGAVKQHTTQNFFSSMGDWFVKNQKWTRIKDIYDSIDEILLKIKPPTRISRTPRTIQDMSNWTASEWRNWTLFYSLPCLKRVLQPVYFDHFALIVNAAYILNSDSIDEKNLKLAKKQLSKYVEDMATLWGLDSMSYNVHLMTHIADSVRNWGPLWCFSTFSFESWNGDIIKMISSPYHRDHQIVARFLLKKIVTHAINDETVNPLVKENIKKSLNGVKSFSSDFTLVGKSTVCRTNSNEESALLDSNFKCKQYLSFIKATLNGVDYQCEDNHRRKTCNSVAYCNDIGFVQILKFITFTHENQHIIGMFVRQFKEIKRVFNTCHISQVSERKKILFCAANSINGPAIICNVNTVKYAMKLSTYWDSD